MEKFTVHTGLVAPMDRANVDTDQIIPKQFLKSIKRTGFGSNLFDAWRYLDEGWPGKPESERRPNPDFVLNQARYRARASWSRAGISVAAARASTRPGRSPNTDFARSSRPRTPISSTTTAARTVCSPSFWPKGKSTGCCTMSPLSTDSAGRRSG